MRIRSILPCLFAGIAAAQLPPAPISPPISDSIVRIEGVLNGAVTLKNTGQRAITGVALQITIPDSQNYTDLIASNWMFGAQLEPGSEVPVNVSSEITPQNLNQQVRVVALIFADGTHIGHAVYRAVGAADVIHEMFGQRNAVASEWSYWSGVVANLPRDDAEAIQQFLAKVDAMPGPPTVHGHNGFTSSLAESARESVRVGIRADAEHIREALQNRVHDPTWIRQNVLAKYAETAASAKAVTADNGEATQ
jgi:hypothetical protein